MERQARRRLPKGGRLAPLSANASKTLPLRWVVVVCWVVCWAWTGRRVCLLGGAALNKHGPGFIARAAAGRSLRCFYPILNFIANHGFALQAQRGYALETGPGLNGSLALSRPGSNGQAAAPIFSSGAKPERSATRSMGEPIASLLRNGARSSPPSGSGNRQPCERTLVFLAFSARCPRGSMTS